MSNEVVQAQVVQATVIGAGETDLLKAPGQVDGMMIYQKTSQCCRCLCCQPNIDWTVHDYVEDWSADMSLAVKMTITEDSSWFGRCMSHCYPAWRAIKYSVHNGDENGPVLFTIEKGFTCSNCPLIIDGDGGPVRCPCCCCLPYLEAKSPNGEHLGKVSYICDACPFVPKYDVFDKKGVPMYRVRPDTCVGGLCVQCRCGGGTKGKCFRIPFPIREPMPPYRPVGDAAITDLWAGMKHECCTNREMYQVKFPQNMKDAETVRKLIMATTLLIDITLNEQDQ
ncbi:Plscr3 [Symbiodinium sp. CCMP2592]|nr:Plscr3 [Symbiodinium sp. CCMP2592]